MLLSAPIWYAYKQATQIEIRKIRILQSKEYPVSMETQMETYPISLVVDDFGVEYVGKQFADNLATILKKYHNITEDW